MKYQVISADTHTDIVWLPEELFVSQAPKHLRGQMPRVVDTAEGKVWMAGGARLGFVAAAALTGSYEPYQPGRSLHLDKMEEMGFFSDADKGLFHPTTPELRLRDQDADGIQAEVIYGVLGVATGFSDAQGGISDPEVVATIYDIYNGWIADFCKSSPGRFAALACVSCHDPQIAVKQLRQAASLGLKGAEINVSSAFKPIYQREWDILWATAAECRMPISFHTIGLSYRMPEDPADDRYQWISLGLMYTLFQLSGPEFLTSILLSGACDAHPQFKFVLGECGVGWLPYVLYRIDQEYADRLFHLKLSMKPTEFWRRQGYTTFQDERLTPEVIQAVGEDNIFWGSDYPHPDSVWPESQQVLRRNLGHLDERLRRKLVCENSGKLYGFIR